MHRVQGEHYPQNDFYLYIAGGLGTLVLRSVYWTARWQFSGNSVWATRPTDAGKSCHSPGMADLPMEEPTRVFKQPVNKAVGTILFVILGAQVGLCGLGAAQNEKNQQ